MHQGRQAKLPHMIKIIDEKLVFKLGRDILDTQSGLIQLRNYFTSATEKDIFTLFFTLQGTKLLKFLMENSGFF